MIAHKSLVIFSESRLFLIFKKTCNNTAEYLSGDLVVKISHSKTGKYKITEKYKKLKKSIKYH